MNGESVTEQIEAHERQLAKAKKAQVTLEKLRKLMSNSTFKEVILDGFCRIECARYVQQSIDPSLTEAQRKDALGFAQAAGYLLNWLAVNEQLNSVVTRDIESLEINLEELRSLPEEVTEG